MPGPGTPGFLSARLENSVDAEHVGGVRGHRLGRVVEGHDRSDEVVAAREEAPERCAREASAKSSVEAQPLDPGRFALVA